MSVSASSTTIAGRTSRNMIVSLGEMQGGDGEVDRLDPNERNDHAADAVDQKIEAQQSGGTNRAIAHPLQRKRNERDNDHSVEYDGGQDGALWGRQPHDIECLQLWIKGDEHCRNDGKILRYVVGDRE